MADSLSTKHLLACLQEKEKYKGTLAYLQEANKYNENVYDMINQSLETVLLSKHNNYMAKLLGLRLFKEVVLTGNFTLIDGLNEQIEEEIVKVTQYNKKCKEINRGANYFIQIEKHKKDNEVQKVGSSYVLLASEILMALGKWYPVDEEGQRTRFAEWFQKLSASGVPFHDFNFFKKEDEEKFRNNYQKWIKWYMDKVKEEEVEETSKNLKAQKSSKVIEREGKDLPISASAKQPEAKKEQNHRGETDGQKIDSHNKASNLPEVLQTDSSKPLLNEKQKPHQNDLLESLQQKIRLLEIKLQTTQKDYESLKSQYSSEIILLKDQRTTFEKSFGDANKLLSEYQQKIGKMKEELEGKDKVIGELNKANKELGIELVKKEQQPKSQIDPVGYCYNIKLTPPRQYEQLEEQNDLLKSALQNAEENYLAKQKEFDDQLTFVKQANKRLREEVELKSKLLQEQRSKKGVQQELVRNIIRQDSLVVQDEPRIYYKTQPLGNAGNDPQARGVMKSCSVSEYLRGSSKPRASENMQPIGEVRPRSLKKTESQHRLQKEVQGFSNTGLNYDCKQKASKLTKKTNKQSHPSDLDLNNNVVTYYPFLQNYFQPLPQPNPQFKRSCLEFSSKRDFFENELIKGSLRKTNELSFELAIVNKGQNQIKVKLLAGHYSFRIEGQKAKKIKGGKSEAFYLVFDNLDFNLRYPVVSVVIGNQRISLANSTSQEKHIHLALPLTLLDFCTVRQEANADWLPTTKTTKYCSNKLNLSRLNSSIDKALPFFKISHSPSQVTAEGALEFMGDESGRVWVSVQQKERDICMCISFGSDSGSGSSLAKVLMQVLLYLLQK